MQTRIIGERADMKHLVALCCLLVLIGCSNQDSLIGGEEVTGEIPAEQIIDAFMSYTQKVNSVVLTDAKIAEWLNALQGVKDDPLLAPYVFPGEKLDRQAIRDDIARDKAKVSAANMSGEKREKYAFEPSNLDGLTDAELVIASRLVRQLADKIK